MGITSAIKCIQLKLPSVRTRHHPPANETVEKDQDVFIDIPHPPASLKAGLLLKVWSDIDASQPPYALDNLAKHPEKLTCQTNVALEATLINENLIEQAPIAASNRIPTKPKRPPFLRTASATSTKSTTSTSSNPYHFWNSGFGVPIESAPLVLFSNKSSFLTAVKGELHNVEFIQTGLSSYLRCINTGEHHTFSEEFLRKQNTATHITLGQLCQIKEHLEDVVREVEGMDQEDDGEDQVAEHLTEAFGHAKPWIATTRAILVSSHVFYKINYVLAKEHESSSA